MTVLNNTSSGTATSGSYFTVPSGTLNFTSDEILATFTASTLVEGNETFTLTLSTQTGAATLGMAAATVSIVDNDGASGGLDSGFAMGRGSLAARSMTGP